MYPFRVEVILREAKSYENMETREQCLAYLGIARYKPIPIFSTKLPHSAGSSFRIALRVPDRMTDVQVGQFLLDRYIFVHISPAKNKQKFDLLSYPYSHPFLQVMLC